MQLAGAVALVTGGSSGLGAALATALSSQGTRVLVHGRDEARTTALAEEIGGVALLADLEDPPRIDDLARRAVAAHGHIDLLINNAGRGWAGPFPDMSAPEVDRLISLNLRAPILLTRALLPQMLRRRSGHICFVSSIAGRTSVAGESVYAATKSGLDAFADSLRLETTGTGVGVSVAVPGVIDTPFFAHRGRGYERARPRPLPPADVADAVVQMIEHGTAEVWVPRWLRAASVVRHMAPGFYRALAAQFGGSTRLTRDAD